jgi:hypothetical protein
VFEKARADLADLRLSDASGRELPYALRIRLQDLHLAFDIFNTIDNPDGSLERTIDLRSDLPQHNCVKIQTDGTNFRRVAKLEGSNNNQDWRLLAESNLLSFSDGAREFEVSEITYPVSRFRYLRLQIKPDPAIDKDVARIKELTVLQHALAPAEFVTRDAKLGPREPAPTSDGPGSRWIIDLGGDRLPCDRLDFDVADDAFARDFRVEAEGRPDWRRQAEDGYSPAPPLAANSNEEQWRSAAVGAEAPETFTQIDQGLWRRLAGTKHVSLTASFAEQRASRLRLTVTDHSNPPLKIESATYTAPARQLTIANTQDIVGPLRLYFGNFQAKAPEYDFERNLPAQLSPLPTRIKLGAAQANPRFVPFPLPFSERWPGLVYLALASACVAVGVLLVSVGRTAIAQHDAAHAAESSAAASKAAESSSAS